MVFQGTVLGPALWNVYIDDLALVIEFLGFRVVLFADDVNAYKEFPPSVPDDDVYLELRNCQTQVHAWGAANQVVFDGGKESFSIVSSFAPSGPDFKLLGLLFDTRLNMRECIHNCVVEAGWRRRSLLRTRRFYNDSELIHLFKSHVLSYVE